MVVAVGIIVLIMWIVNSPNHTGRIDSSIKNVIFKEALNYDGVFLVIAPAERNITGPDRSSAHNFPAHVHYYQEFDDHNNLYVVDFRDHFQTAGGPRDVYNSNIKWKNFESGYEFRPLGSASGDSYIHKIGE